MKTIKKSIVILSCVFAIALAVYAFRANSLQDLQSSHINANVPDEKDFDSILKRDLEKYFSDLQKEQTDISYELLRKGPTQVGIAYPKYYLWVKVNINGKLVHEGAVRVAAIEKKRFQITHYLKKEDIQSNSTVVYEVFPQALCESIIEKAKP